MSMGICSEEQRRALAAAKAIVTKISDAGCYTEAGGDLDELARAVVGLQDAGLLPKGAVVAPPRRKPSFGA